MLLRTRSGSRARAHHLSRGEVRGRERGGERRVFFGLRRSERTISSSVDPSISRPRAVTETATPTRCDTTLPASKSTNPRRSPCLTAATPSAVVVIIVIATTVSVVVERRHLWFGWLHQEGHLPRDGVEPAEILRI